MIYRVRASGEFVTSFLKTGNVIRKTKVIYGLPDEARLFLVYPSEDGTWTFLYEGKPNDGTPDVEGEIRDFKPIFSTNPEDLEEPDAR